MNTTENNKIIAEFMGWSSNETKTVYYEPLDQVEGIGGFDVKNLPFNNWNFLMEVVEKIESLKPIKFLSGRNWLGFEVKIYKTLNTQTHYCPIKYIKESGEMTITNGFSKVSKIEAVYNACIAFIEWYNKQ